MNITKGELRKLVAEETIRVKEGKDELETLVEGYSAAYECDEDTILKEALIDFLEVLDETRIPRIAFEAFMKNLPEELISPILKEVVEE